MKVSVMAAGLALMLAAGPGWAQQPGVKPTDARPTGMGQHGTADTEQTGKEPLSGTDKQFLGAIAQSNAAEMQMGQLAAQQAAQPVTRMYGRWITTSHGFAMQELTMLAGLRDEQPTMGVSGQAKAAIDRLRPLKGAEFDQAFIKAQVTELQQGLATAQKEGTDGNDRLLKRYAENLILVFQAQLDAARTLQHGAAAQ